MTWERQRAYDLEAGYEKGVKENAIANAKKLISLGVEPQTVAMAVLSL